MQALKLRPGSSDVAQKTSTRTGKGSPSAVGSPDIKSSKIMERRPSNKSVLQPEKRVAKVSEQVVQLQEELKKAKEDSSWAVVQLAEAKKAMKSQKKVEVLESEVQKAKHSERKMLESLIEQTKQLEQTKMSLEEAKLEIKSLQESINSLEGSAGQSSRNLGKHQEENGSNDMVGAREEIRVLRHELKLATEAEEKSKQAMDDLAIALNEVTTDTNRANGQLSIAQSELQAVRSEAGQLKTLLKTTEEKYRAAAEEAERVKLEFEKSLAAWTAKENGFIDCMKVSEEEISKMRQENDRLISSQRLSREDNSKLRDILKHAVNEATVIKESLEIARKETTQLKELLAEKENALQRIRQDYDGLKVSEAAAVDSVNELKSMLGATSTVKSIKSAGTMDERPLEQPKVKNNGARSSEKPKAASNEIRSFEQPKERINEVRSSEKPKAASNEIRSFEQPKERINEVRSPEQSKARINEVTSEQPKARPNEVRSCEQPKAASNEAGGRKNVAKLSSENWKIDNPRLQPGRRHSVGGDEKLKGFVSDTEKTPEYKDRKLQSVSNMTDLRIPPSLFLDNSGPLIFDDFNHLDRNHLVGMGNDNGPLMKQKKKKPMFRRFGDMIRRRSFHK